MPSNIFLLHFIMSDEPVSDEFVHNDNLERNMMDRSDVKCLEQIKLSALPSGADNRNSNSKQTGKIIDGGLRDRKKKTRRGKPKRKKPYNKEITVSRIKNYAKSRTNNCSRFRNRHPVAPNNTNEFLMEDHKDIQVQELDERLQASANKANDLNPVNIGNQNRPSRVRDSSFTSADSDEEYFYSSPEDEEEFLTKEFSNTYKDLHAESLQNMSKSELIQHILQLETRIDILEQRLGSQNKSEVKEDGNDKIDDKKPLDKDKTASEYEKELEKWKHINDQLAAENMMLQRQIRASSVSTVDSESDSSSSSDSSASSVSGCDDEMNSIDDVNPNTSKDQRRDNGVKIPQSVCSMESEDVT